MSTDQDPTSPGQDLKRNDRCHCGSGKKYKQCCLAADETAAREVRAKQAEAAAAEAEAAEPAEGDDDPKGPERKRKGKREQSHQPWKRGSQAASGAQQRTMPRKSGAS